MHLHFDGMEFSRALSGAMKYFLATFDEKYAMA